MFTRGNMDVYCKILKPQDSQKTNDRKGEQ
ncbi:Uncharacterised protein [Vibrio cholerae]|nr:Uncharacterised protein [Vibrio cholerae]